MINLEKIKKEKDNGQINNYINLGGPFILPISTSKNIQSLNQAITYCILFWIQELQFQSHFIWNSRIKL